MLDRIAEGVLSVLNSVPGCSARYAEFLLIRAMLAKLLIVIVVYVIAMAPFRSVIAGIEARATR